MVGIIHRCCNVRPRKYIVAEFRRRDQFGIDAYALGFACEVCAALVSFGLLFGETEYHTLSDPLDRTSNLVQEFDERDCMENRWIPGQMISPGRSQGQRARPCIVQDYRRGVFGFDC
jgi:hypothetical protein